MRRTFVRVSKGDRLGASLINAHSDAIRECCEAGGGGGQAHKHKSITTGINPHIVHHSVVVSDGSSTEERDLKVRPQYFWFDPTYERSSTSEDRTNLEGEWRGPKSGLGGAGDTTQYFLDPKACLSRFEKGDVLYTLWNAQRNGYVAIPNYREAGVIPFKNDTGATRLRFDVIGLEGTVNDVPDNPDADDYEVSQDHFEDQLACKGVIPTDPEHVGKFAIFQGVPKRPRDNDDEDSEKLESGDMGWAVYAGVSYAYVRLDDEDHEFVDIINGETNYLKSIDTPNTGSGQILWIDDAKAYDQEGEEFEEDVRWAIIRFPIGGAVRILWVKITNRTEVPNTFGTGASGKTGLYGWKEVCDNGSGWTEKEGGMVSDNQGLAVFQNFNNPSIEVASDYIVRIQEAPRCTDYEEDQYRWFILAPDLTNEDISIRATL